MKFYTETVVDYVKNQVELELKELGSGAPAELRVFTQSMPPQAIYRIFEKIEDYVASKSARIACHLKVAYGLDQHWLSSGLQGYAEESTRLNDNGWVDKDDRLTLYRNLIVGPQEDLLLVLLAGIDHASDQGGLADFNVINENVLFRDGLNGGYTLWVERFLHDANLPFADGAAVLEFSAFFEQLFKIRPRNLFQLSEFLEKFLLPVAVNCNSASEALALAYEQLPFWGIPPLLSSGNPANLLPLLDDASRLFKRDAYREAAARKKALQNIDQARQELAEAPKVISGVPYGSVDEFLDTLESFVQRGASDSIERLLQTDFVPVIQILKVKPPRPSSRRRAPMRLRGSVFSSFSTGIFLALEEFVKECGRDFVPSQQLKQIKVTIERFEFDTPKQESDQDIAEDTYRGLIGGIDGFFSGLELEPGSEPDSVTVDEVGVPLCIAFGGDDKPVQIESKSIKESRLTFRVTAVSAESKLTLGRTFVWLIPPTHEERVRYNFAKKMHEELNDNPSLKLPVVHMGSALDELYFAIDDEEAHRLFSTGMHEAIVRDVLDGLPFDELEDETQVALKGLADAYRIFISVLATQGYFMAIEKPLLDLVKSYSATVDSALARHQQGKVLGEELLRRLYQAFVCVPVDLPPTSPFVPALVATGITPAIAETVLAREVFLRDGLVETLQTLLQKDARAAKADFDRLMGLVELRRPIYGLVFDASKTLTTNLRSFGLIHRLGEKPKKTPTLAAQAEMRSEDVSAEDGLSTYLRTTSESKVIERTLKAYRQIHPFAADRISILAANIEDLRPVVAGIDSYILTEAKAQSDTTDVPLVVSVRVIGRGPSATRAQEVLRRWQERWNGSEESRLRPCKLKIAYRPARTRDEVQSLLEAVSDDYDVGFLFDFLNDQCGGDSVVPTKAFEIDWTGQVGKFPICEHPRLASPTDPNLRRGLVSNRRFKVAARHAELTARLKNPEHPGSHHVVFNQVEYGDLEQQFTHQMHRCCRWVACMDRFVDKALILNNENAPAAQRKLVGFASGVGSYGELNLTLSTESNTTGELVRGVSQRLGQIYTDWTGPQCEAIAHKIMDEAQAVTGLSLVSALGNEGVMRDVIGYALANRLYLDRSGSLVCAALPLDSYVHWFDGAEEGIRPDLLLLEARVEQGTLVIDATVVECKVGQESGQHVGESVAQAAAGLVHLSSLFLPISAETPPIAFDRRYWWAQLHRALVVRNIMTLKPSEKNKVEHALEQMSEGQFVINWRAIGATFWTNDLSSAEDGLSLRRESLAGYLPVKGQRKPLEVHHAAIGQSAVLDVLLNDRPDVKRHIWPSEATEVGELPKIDETNEELKPASAVSLEAQRPLVSAHRPTAVLKASFPEEPVIPAAETESSSEQDEVFVQPQETPSVELPRNVLSGVPERLLIGQELTAHGGKGQPVYWEFGHKQLPNRHLLVFGGSGNGKTYAIQALLLEMAKAKQSSLVIDYTDGFLPQHLEAELLTTAKPQNYALAAGNKLPLDPFKAQADEIEGIGHISEKPFDVAKRVASIFTAVYSSLGEQQKATLVDNIEQGVKAGSLTLEGLYDQLKDDGQDLLANKIMPLARTEPFEGASESAWSEIFGGQQSLVQILQLVSIPTEIQRLIIEFVLWDLWDFMKRTGSKDRPLPVVLDEVQNLDHRSGSPLEKYLREGRKFGASMILATQTLSNFSSDQRDRLFQAAHKLFFAPASTELKTYAAILRDMVPNSTTESWGTQLSTLKKGECLSAGYEQRPDGELRVAVRKVSVTALGDRLEDAL